MCLAGLPVGGKEEGVKMTECCICGDQFTGWGNNPEPFKGERCCNACNDSFVIPTRMCLGRGFADENILMLIQTIAELGAAMRQINVDSRRGTIHEIRGTDGQRSTQES